MQRLLSIGIGLLCALLAALLLWAYQGTLTSDPGSRLADLAAARVPDSGVGNPVTAVLLNFRAYDTLLELGVLLVALLGIWALGPARPGYQPAGQALRAMTSWVAPLLLLAGGYMLWAGAYAPGGAFQAGALLGGAGVLLRLAGHPGAGLPAEPALRWLIAGGVGVFTLIGLALLAGGYGFLTYPATMAKWLILAIETAAMLAIGATLAAAYVGGRPPSGGR